MESRPTAHVIAQRTLTIHHLQVTGAPRTATVASRLAIERLLGSADLQPPSMPPAAILVVRHMRDPQPGRLAPGYRALHVRREWEAQARQQLAAHYAAAAHPAWGPVATNADAVCFADESEMLACLARDSMQETGLDRWWWRSIVSNLRGARTELTPPAVTALVAAHMAQHAQLIPAVLARLHQWDAAARFVHALTPPQAAACVHALCAGYQLPTLPPIDDPPAPAEPSSSHTPWHSVVTPANLSRTQAALMGLALDLSLAPYARSRPTYWRAVQRWWQSTAENSTPAANGPAHPLHTSPPDDSQPAEKSPHAARAVPHEQPDHAVSPDPDGTVPAADVPPHAANSRTHPDPDHHARAADVPKEPRGLDPARGEKPPHEAGAEQQEFAAPLQSARHAEPPDAHESDYGTPDAATHAPGGVAAPDAETVPPDESALPAPWPADGIASQLGGLFYLVNLMAALDLPSCFEEEWRLASGVGSWGLLELLAREVLGSRKLNSAGPTRAVTAWVDDPLWEVLARLDARPSGQLPGYRLPHTRPRQWPAFTFPAAWLAQVPQPDRAKFASGDYRPWRPKGRYAPRLARWLSRAMPLIAFRLCRALDLDNDSSLAAELLHVPGTLFVTATHIDLVTSMEQISFAVRLAGLDRDPGWQPDFGRVFYFHFE